LKAGGNSKWEPIKWTGMWLQPIPIKQETI
jgi:hypothetical protein